METLTVHRGDLTLNVVEAPDIDLWDFWGQYAAGKWEPGTFEVLDQFLTPAGVYVDLGAWIGPTVLYASSRCGLVVAVEPDPVAFDQLRSNLKLNGIENHVLFRGAVDTHGAGTVLFAHGKWGDSMSSVMLPGDTSVVVPTTKLADLLDKWDGIDLIKMDIEGAESLVLPDAIGLIAGRRIPCLVSLHEDWYAPGGKAVVAAALDEFDRTTVLDTDATSAFRTVLCEWE